MKITKILSIEDTRDFIELGDRFVPVSHSGIENECHRCGRLHEVHATVELEDGTIAVVGTTCMKAGDSEIIRKLKSGANTAKTLKRLRAELAAAEEILRLSRAAWEKVNELTVPDPVFKMMDSEITVGREKGKQHFVVEVGDKRAWIHNHTTEDTMNHTDKQERIRCATNGWKSNRFREMFPDVKSPVHGKVDDLKSRIEKTEERLADLLDSEGN